MVLGPKNTIADVDLIFQEQGFAGIPITEDGTLKGKLIGIVTNRDVDFEPERNCPLQEVMVTDLVTAPEGVTLNEANKIHYIYFEYAFNFSKLLWARWQS